MSAQHPPCGRAQFRLAPVCKWSCPAPEGTPLRWELAYSPGRSHASRTPSFVGCLLAFCAPPNTRPDSVAGVRLHMFHFGRWRMPLTWQKFGFAKERHFPPFHMFQLHPLHSTRAGAPHSKQPPPLRPLGGWGSFGNILRVPILRPPAWRVLPSEIFLFTCKFPTECIYAILSAPKCINIHFTFCAPGSSGRAP